MNVVSTVAVAVSLVLVLYVWISILLLRQNGRLLLRVDALEERAGIAAANTAGLAPATPAPKFSLAGLDGQAVTLDNLIELGRPVVLIFAEPGCRSCETLLPDVAEWQREHAERLTIALISRGQIKPNRADRDTHGLRNLLVQEDREVAQAYLSVATPAAVVIRDGHIDTPLAEGADAVRSLIVRALLPPPVKQGEPAPSFELTGADGQVFNFADLRGRNVVLLFWDSDDWNSTRMLPDLITQERLQLVDAPELIIVASGSARAKRIPDLRARVLLDPHLAARTLFGADYTPAAVLIDKDGRVASRVGRGYVSSFEIVGIVPFVPSENETVDAMLKLAGVGGDDVIYDLGCGDGRIVVTAAKTYGARGVGVDINPERLAEARANARQSSVEHLVRFEQRTLPDVDLTSATVVTLYLLPSVLMKLRPMLKQLKPGTRIVSHGFDMDDWKPDQEVNADGATLYLWTIPPPVTPGVATSPA